ncbi:MAG: proline--tRNA ligase [Pseudomonadota bacterium]
MRAAQFHITTVKETPADAEIASHQLMLRTAMIRRLTSGIYTWTPLGFRVLRKVENIVREEMNRAGALEMLMPAVQPAELWRESGRWDVFGPQLLKMVDRAEREFCFGPTHEEVISEFARDEIRSYKQLPVNFYQIQTKFRDEIRPRFGVMRAREFIMKDGYSFHLDQASMDETYQRMYDAYSRMCQRMGLEYRAVQADSGAIGGSHSHEFQVIAESGEDAIAYCPDSEYAANVETAEAVPSITERPQATASLEKVATPTQRTIQAVAEHLDVAAAQCLKTLVVADSEGELVILVLRGDHQLNEIKLGRLARFAEGFAMATEAQIQQAFGAEPGFLGPVGTELPVIADRSAALLADFVCGANENGFHFVGANWERDAAITETADLRNVEAGDPSPDGAGTLAMARGIEVGHIFQLGTKYSESMGVTVLDEQGKAQHLLMGCYGIGVSRFVAAAIEQHHDEAGIRWPLAIAPFELALLPMNAHKSHRVREAVEQIYADLQAAGVEVVLDDRGLRPGVMFADWELIGVPHRLVVGEKGLDQGQVEYRARGDSENQFLPLATLVTEIQARLAHGG